MPGAQGFNVINLLSCMGRSPELAISLKAMWKLGLHKYPAAAW